MKIFKDRKAAGQILAERLKGVEVDLVLAIPRGGVVVGEEIAEKLNLPLDIIITRKIGAPTQSELALGAVDSEGQVVWEENLINDLGLKIEDLKEIVADEVEEIKRREQVYRQDKPLLNVEGKTVILVDDGIATGATIISALRFLKRHGIKRVILAIPVGSRETVEKVSKEADEVVVLHTPDYFQAVGQFYQNFLPVSDQEVIQLLGGRLPQHKVPFD